MDKFDKLLDAVEHPERYSDEELLELSSDPETSEIYRGLCAARSSEFSKETLSETEVEKEWRKFSGKRKRIPFMRRSPRRIAAAAAIAVAVCSVLAVGITVGIRKPHDDSAPVQSMPVATIAANASADSPDVYADSIPSQAENLVFENETLKTVLDRLAPHYGIKTVYRSENAGEIRLFFRWDSSLSLDDVISQLNTFDRIKLHIDGGTLIVE